VVLVDAHGTVAGERTFPHGGEGLCTLHLVGKSFIQID
jgi:hypothetical protein